MTGVKITQILKHSKIYHIARYGEFHHRLAQFNNKFIILFIYF